MKLRKRRYDTRINIHTYARAVAMDENLSELRTLAHSWGGSNMSDFNKAKWAEVIAVVLEKFFADEDAVREQLREELEA